MTSPAVLVDGTVTTNGVDVIGGSTVTVQLADLAGVRAWTCRVWSADDNTYGDIASINAGIVIDNATRTATFTAPSSLSGITLLMESIVNGQVDVNGRLIPEWRTSFGIFVPMPSGRRRLAVGQVTEGNAGAGWVKDLNNLIEFASIAPATAGDGMVFLGGAYNIVATDPSIVVNTDSIRVGVLQNATQHGVQVGGTTHALATSGSPGFMSSADKIKLDTATTSALPSSLVLRDVGGNVYGTVFYATNGVDTPILQSTIPLSVNVPSATVTGPILANGHVQTDDVSQARFIRLTLNTSNLRWNYADIGSQGDGLPVNASAASTSHAIFELTEIPQGVRIDQITVRIDPPAHGGAWPPAAAPAVSLWRANAVSGAPALVGSIATDSLSVQANYEAAHNIILSLAAVSPATRIYDKGTDRWTIRVTPEFGVNALAGTIIYAIQVQYTVLAGSSIVGN